MTQKIKNICKFSILQSFSSSCLSLNYHESILYLRNPKLLCNILYISDANDVKVEFSNFLNASSFNLKNEKKNKTSIKSLGVIDNKKNKSKHKKKIRTKINPDQNLSNTSRDLELSDLKDVSFFRNYKNVKSKKNSKHAINIGKGVYLEQNVNQEKNTKEISLNDLLTVKELAKKLNMSSADIIKWLFLQGISATINQVLDSSILNLIAQHYSFTIAKSNKQFNSRVIDKKNPINGRPRSPIITLFGHVDHGKTSLLQAIRRDKKLNEEPGSITQSIRAYEVLIEGFTAIKKLIFFDTPGHEAFISMRKRGAEMTDLVILVISADDALRAQTIESINYIKSRNLPFLVAITKIDKPQSNIQRVKEQLTAYDIYDQDNDGVNIITEVSSLTGKNIGLLLSNIIKLSMAQQLKSDPLQQAEGTVLEAHLDRRRGPVAQLLVQNGTLYLGNIVVAGNIYGKVKAINNSLNQKVSYIESASLAEVLCFTSVPSAGLSFNVVNDEKTAKSLAAQFSPSSNSISTLNARISLDRNTNKGDRKPVRQINVIVKTDTQGSIGAIVHALSQIPQGKVKINLLLVGVGEISLKDIRFASTSKSIVLGFNLNLLSTILQTAEALKITVKTFNVIYDLIDYVSDYMLNFVEVSYQKYKIGRAVIKSLFTINRGIVAGCLVVEGKLKKQAYFNLRRANSAIYTGIIDSVKRMKEDVDEVLAGYECGITCNTYNLWTIEDSLEIYELRPLQKTL